MRPLNDPKPATESRQSPTTPRHGRSPGQWIALVLGVLALVAAGAVAAAGLSEPVTAPALVSAADVGGGAEPHEHEGTADTEALEAGDEDGSHDSHSPVSDDHQAETTAGAGPDGSTGAEVIAISMTEFTYSPANLELEAGTHVFEVTNNGQVPHELALAKAGAHHGHGAATRELAPGETQALTVELTPGEYSYMCHIAGHLEAGMEATLTVTE